MPKRVRVRLLLDRLRHTQRGGLIVCALGFFAEHLFPLHAGVWRVAVGLGAVGAFVAWFCEERIWTARQEYRDAMEEALAERQKEG